ncbi:esterase-like activity of phytase family protein [Succinivibrio faecicola]|uniref:Esterase-like activity of phytase family protein n=1 Tax=Succinivibrio faecicola TaxID=2820300 RepID=A0ABS7DFJ6_9GAMM|nr:esterase-like activity of phytase family protein [Succinivibrio faecicola]MBW7570072.1 esterase-like activity of phytase family protein [Succinivibrio faecicola]
MKFISKLFITSLPFLALSAQAIEISKINIELDKSQYVKYSGSNKSLKNGFKTGFGSSLTYYKMGDHGELYFYGLTDRGPNGDAPNFKAKDGSESASKFFLAPDFTPQIGLIRVEKNKATIEKVITLKDQNSNKISGLPIPKGKIGTTNEVGLTDSLEILPFDNKGLDPEGITIDKDGNFYICDEYGPFVIKYSKDGKELNRFYPGNGLPEILKYRIENRGCEGISITPSGELAVLEQSVLEIKRDGKKSSPTAKFTRVVLTDPNTGKFRTYAYPIDADEYKKTKDAKLGDILALSDTEFLIIEQGKDKNKKMRNLIYKVDFSNATDITDFYKDGFEPEFYQDSADIVIGEKTLVADLRALGYVHEKAEGLALLDDRQTLVVINDNDFGLDVKIKDKKRKEKITDYTVDSNKQLYFDSLMSDAKIKFSYLSDEESVNELFFIKLDEKL